MISIHDLSFNYAGGAFRLHIPALEIQASDRVALVGSSGSGKTTLINLLAGILTPSGGHIDLAGVRITQYGAEDRQDFRIIKMGLIFQEFELLDYLDVYQNILLPYRISPLLTLGPEVKQRAEELAEAVGLGDKLRRLPRHLSQGERQRCAVCRALITRPALLLCDEPTGNLDPENRDQVLEILFDYARTENTPLIVVTHDREVLDRFNRILDIKAFAV